MRYVIVGAGAIGSALGAHLHRTGHHSLLVGREAHVQRIRDRGLQVIGADQTLTIDVPAVVDIEDARLSTEDVVLLCVKSQDTDRALVDIRAAGGDSDTLPIVCMQNSIVNEPAAARYFKHVYGAVVVVAGAFLEPGVVYNTTEVSSGFLELGRFPTGVDELTAELAQDLRRASYASEVSPAVMTAKAGKMFTNLGNALLAITDTRDGAEYTAHLYAEAEQCFQAAGVPYEPVDAFLERVSHFARLAPMPPGLRNLGSTWQSLQRGLPSSEVDYLNGEIVRLGRLHDVPTPYNEVLQVVLSQMVTRGDRPGAFSVADLEELARGRAADRHSS